MRHLFVLLVGARRHVRHRRRRGSPPRVGPMLYVCSGMARVGPEDLARWKASLYSGDQIDASIVRRLVAEVELLRTELSGQRVEFARKAALALEKRLHDVGAFNSGGCPKCRDAEARAFLSKLKKIASITP